jgi:hypothetical protein
MSTTEAQTASPDPRVGKVDMKLEVHIIPCPTSTDPSSWPGNPASIPSAPATGRSSRSTIRTAMCGWSKRSRRGAPAGSTPLAWRSRPRRIWSVRFGVPRPPTARTRTARGIGSRSSWQSASRPGLARLVRLVHGGGAGRDGPAYVTDLAPAPPRCHPAGREIAGGGTRVAQRRRTMDFLVAFEVDVPAERRRLRSRIARGRRQLPRRSSRMKAISYGSGSGLFQPARRMCSACTAPKAKWSSTVSSVRYRSTSG